MEKKIESIVNKVFKTDNAKVLFRLIGGMSNYTYVVSSDGVNYTVRVPGEFAEYFVNRNDELVSLKLFEELGYTNKTVYFNLEDGVKISLYVDGKALNEITDRHYDKVSSLLHKIHESNILSEKDYLPFARLTEYEKYLKDLDFVIPDEYFELKNTFLKFENYLSSQKKVLCHNDSQPSNFIITTDNDLLVVDFEFVGNNDLVYDIACFGNTDMKDAKELLKHYYKDEINDDILLRFYLWRAFQCFQWYNVAMFKDLKGMSEKLKLDFKVIAIDYLHKAEQNLKIALKNPLASIKSV